MSESLPINPQILKWARERAGYSIDDLVKGYPKIKEWEESESYPTYNQLVRLSGKFKCPIAVFFFPEPPKIEPIEKSFRTLPDHEFVKLPPKIRILLHKAKAMQISLSELNEGINPANKQIIRDLAFNVDASLPEVAGEVRAYLNIVIEKQVSWKDHNEAFEMWRQILADHGVFVFKDAFKEKSYSGFSLYDEKFPIIFVNNSSATTRQIFTLFHELAHLIFRTSGIDRDQEEYIKTLENDQKKIEVFCNRFSGVFLVPDDVFNDFILGKDLSEKDIEELANRFKVSREVILRKLLDRNLVSNSYYKEKTEEWSGQVSPKGTGGNYYYNQIAYLGRQYIDLALTKYHQNRINVEQVSDYLNLKPKYFGNFEDVYLRKRT